ncbi:electron transporter RnfD [Methylovulum psychrotolerans]|uniref:Ion-translocating oxidoreductase complex subunit D n=2 Tax=Methylovulum psychrotolerans TaxID=1704499 RepID=A0A1Z4BXQ5_9GAMM|nr:RnfABCDGE type electron transport complex subunit D [Methylovulum psychrotolerans]ASF46041.1 electron transporter RnfD [Methylovulum psychrotolerans]MBT9099735.1 RnfABCDGE type electron transport complex subunit D [Methylovulum psychrotolerans]POZ50159.1 electron transporter RnfD [Methylovulum psychrotolerans]
MMILSKPNSGAHIGANRSVRQIMWQVILALSPATVFGLWCFGWPALNLFIITVTSALFFEAFCIRLQGRAAKPVLMDGSALLTGWLLAMTLPPWAPWWIGVVGSGLAIILGKQVYGGLGQNLFNPAMLARVALLISFPIEMTTWANVSPLFFSHSPGLAESWHITFSGLDNLDAYTGATTLGYIKTEFSQNRVLADIMQDYSPILSFIGWSRGSLGEASTLLLALGGIWLIRAKIITWHIPVALLATVTVLASIFHLADSQHYISPFVHLNSGAMMCVAFFIATDYVTSPNTATGQLVFGAGCGLLIFVIRTWGAYPEGAGFAVLLMNSATPLIDHYIRPRIYGRDRKGKPLEIPKP